jgi:DNA-binding SARP family transcriptional activator
MSRPTTRISVFGALEITHQHAAPRRPPTQRVLALLGYLIAHHDVPQSRDKLVDLLWPELLPRQGRRLLSDTLWRARRLLTPPGLAAPPLLSLAGDAVTFRLQPSTTVDLIVFEQQLRRAQASEPGALEQLRSAVELYRGDFLEDCYDDWALYERERLREQYLSALQRLLAHDQAQQAYGLALQSALRLVQADPLREEAHRSLMRLYHLLGRTEDALRAFEQCRVVLDAELGVEPEGETLSLYEELAALHQRRGGVVAQDAAMAGVPILQEVPLVGRADLRAELVEAVEQALVGVGGLLLVAGEAGQGKSRLLREVAAGAGWRGAQVSWGRAREDAQALPFGALREALLGLLSPLRARELAELLPAHTFATLLPLLPELADLLPEQTLRAPAAGEQPAAKLHAALASLLLGLAQLAPQVLMLEDLHWFDLATLEALGAVLPALREARVLLVVSGRADQLAQRPPIWDLLLRFDRIGLLRRVELPGLSVEECADLVRRALRMQHPAPRFSRRLAEATGGNPFFILETLRALYEQGTLRRDAQGVWHTPWDAPETDYQELPLPQGLRQVIDGRVRDLAPQERATLAAAAVLGQNFAPDILARMTIDQTDPHSDREATTGGEWSLVADQLLRRQFLVEESGGYRFGHDTLREVVYGELDEPTRRALHLRAAEVLEHEHYARVEALAQHLYLAEAWEKAIPHLAQAGDHARAICAYRDALRNYDQAIEAGVHAGADAIGPATRWSIQLKRAQVATLLGEYATAICAYEEVLLLTERDQEAADAATRNGTRRSAQIQSLNGLCFVGGHTNDYDLARQASRRAMALASDSLRLTDRAEAYFQAGVVSFRRDDYTEARILLEQARDLYESLDDERGMAYCWYWLAWTGLRIDGATDQVVTLLERARETFQRMGAQYEEQDCTLALANVWLWRGYLPEAIRLSEASLPFFRASDARDKVSEAQIVRAEALRRAGRFEEALDAAQETYNTHVELGRTAAAQYDRIVMGNVLRDLKRDGEARSSLQAALATSDRLNKARALFALVEMSVQTGDLHYAFEQIGEALVLVRWLQGRAHIGVALRLLGQVRAADRAGQLPPASDDLPDAETCFKTSVELLETAQYESDLSMTYACYGLYLMERRCYAQAHATLRQAQTLARRCGMAALIESLQDAVRQVAAPPSAPALGQVRVRLARQGTPRGRPLRADEFAEVIWTVESAEDQEARKQGGKVAERHIRIRRLCAEAIAQGAEPTVGDLAAALGVTGRTVDRDIAALRAAGELVITRGAVV